MTKCIPVTLHKYIALHGAVWSGGTFIYIPENVKVEMPLQAYFRMNTESFGQFEHTLIIVEKNAQAIYAEGCFTKGTLIRTNPDFKNIEDIKEGDKVLTHNGSYKTVYFTQVRPYTGNLYKIKVYGDSSLVLKVTKEHPFLVVKRKYKNFFKLIGYYLAEGSTSKNNSYLNFSFNENESKCINEVELLLKKIFN